MARALNILGAGPMVLLFLLPLTASLVLLLPGLTDVQAFGLVFAHPQWRGAVVLTLFSGVVSTVLALCLAIVVVASSTEKILQRASGFLAMPHLALAMGLGFLIAPTGLLARVIATLFTGWTVPPDWQTTQDPYGLGLVAGLVLKETPFLVWAFASVLQQDELRHRFQREVLVARSLGHGPRATFMRVVLPQLLQRSIWPIIAVFSYGITVVDMALVIGPAQPPTLAQLVWTDLSDGEALTNQRGAAGTVVLSMMVALCLVFVWGITRVMRATYSKWMTIASQPEGKRRATGRSLWFIFGCVYACVVLALLLQSFTSYWPFPYLFPDVPTLQAWQRLLSDSAPWLTTLALAVSTSVMALAVTVLWFETQAETRDRVMIVAALLMLCVPALLVGLGQYRLLLRLQLTGHWLGLFLVHLAPVMAYVFIMLKGAYRSFDPRWQQAATGLGRSRLSFLATIKWPMLKAPLLSALAVGFAVSVAQYVPAQLAAAGRYTTLPMEAVTLTSSGNRALIAASALLLMLLPFMMFRLSAWFSKPRWEQA
jgi:putative thiamine transport system permease protein